MTDESRKEQQMACKATEIKGDTAKKMAFSAVCDFIDKLPPAPSWNPVEIAHQTVSGIRNIVDAKFISDETIHTKLGTHISEIENIKIERFCSLNDSLEHEWGVVVALTEILPPEITWTPVQVFSETRMLMHENKLAVERAAHGEHASNNFKYWVNRLSSGRPGAASIGKPAQTWATIAAILTQYQQDRAAEAALREAKRHGGTGAVPAALSESTLQLGSGFMPPPPPPAKSGSAKRNSGSGNNCDAASRRAPGSRASSSVISDNDCSICPESLRTPWFATHHIRQLLPTVGNTMLIFSCS